MRPDLIVNGQIACHTRARSADGLIGVEIDLFIFKTPPQPFDKDVVPPAARPIHTDLNLVVVQESGEFLARELTALIRIDDLRSVIPDQRLLHGFHAEVRRQRVEEPPRSHPATGPVQNGTQLHEAALHRNGGDIGRPHVVRTRDIEGAE